MFVGMYDDEQHLRDQCIHIQIEIIADQSLGLFRGSKVVHCKPDLKLASH